MPFQLLDLILAGIMIISGLLALMRGFTREVLSLVAWGAAAVGAYFALRNPDMVEFANRYLEPEIVAKIALGGGVFLVILIIVSLISVKLSDAVVDSAAGAFDRTLGFIYGLARGLVLVAIAYIFYGWLIPPEKQEDWVKNARSIPLIEAVKSAILTLVPPDIAETLNNAAILNSAPQGAQPSGGSAGQNEEGYQRNESQGLDQLIQGTQGQGGDQQPQEGEQPSFGGQSDPN
jgi:membrane protein required for colicin V production